MLQRKSSNFLTVCYFYFYHDTHTYKVVCVCMRSSHQYHFFFLLRILLNFFLILSFTHICIGRTSVNKKFIDRAYQHINFKSWEKRSFHFFFVFIKKCGSAVLWTLGETVALFHQYFDCVCICDGMQRYFFFRLIISTNTHYTTWKCSVFLMLSYCYCFILAGGFPIKKLRHFFCYEAMFQWNDLIFNVLLHIYKYFVLPWF